eukprot:COSAG02_NODE_245_length_27293_cov_16.488012_7_plen_90_part_00
MSTDASIRTRAPPVPLFDVLLVRTTDIPVCVVLVVVALGRELRPIGARLAAAAVAPARACVARGLATTACARPYPPELRWTDAAQIPFF